MTCAALLCRIWATQYTVLKVQVQLTHTYIENGGCRARVCLKRWVWNPHMRTSKTLWRCSSMTLRHTCRVTICLVAMLLIIQVSCSKVVSHTSFLLPRVVPILIPYALESGHCLPVSSVSLVSSVCAISVATVELEQSVY